MAVVCLSIGCGVTARAHGTVNWLDGGCNCGQAFGLLLTFSFCRAGMGVVRFATGGYSH